ncbi:MAG: hypothetical protein WAN75_06190 [Xanthobacteraceae bacterium]|jgi:hypothetical protein
MADVLHSSAIDLSRKSEKSYDITILVSSGILGVALIVAIYALAVSPGINPGELAPMVVYP